VELEMDQRLKERITGTTVLVLLAVVLVPLVLDDSRVVETRITTTNIPEQPDEEFTTRLVPIPEQEDIVPVEEETADSPVRPAADTTDPAATETAAEPEPVADAAVAEVETTGLTGWVVQAGSFSRKNADILNEKLRAEGYPSYVVDEPVTAKDGSLLYRVRIGPQVLRSEALKLKAEIKKEMDLDGFVLNYP
jgi:DedD protein